MLRRVFRQKQFFVCVALLALICLVSNLTVNLIQDRTAMTLLHTLCYVAMIPIFRRIGKIVMQRMDGNQTTGHRFLLPQPGAMTRPQHSGICICSPRSSRI